jgi:hypothetical protein
MKIGKKAQITENPALQSWEAGDAEAIAEKEWLTNLLARWILADDVFARMPFIEEYHFAFRPEKEEEREEFDFYLCLRAWAKAVSTQK